LNLLKRVGKKRNQAALMKQVESLQSDLQKRRQLIRVQEELLAARNKATQEIAQQKKAGKDVSEEVQNKSRSVKKIKSAQEELDRFQAQFEANLSSLPNIPHESVPVGASAENNLEVAKKGTPKIFDFEPLSHEILGEKRGWFDFSQAAKITGRAVFNFKRFCRKTRARFDSVHARYANVAGLYGSHPALHRE